MMFLIPTACDAPLYHWPIATGVTVAANIVVFILQFAIPGFTEQWMLSFGVFNPVTWLTAAYLHADLGHLLGNLVFLFVFGLIVEGKIGWWRFVLVYNACAIATSVLVFLITLFASTGACLGASCAIFGLMAICFLWAPENEVHFKLVGLMFFRPFAFGFDITVQTLCYCFVALNFAIAAFTRFAISTEVLHLLGLLPGVAIGWGMIVARRVNCEGHDFVSIMTDKRGQSQLTVEEEAERVERRREAAAEKRAELTQGLEMVAHYTERGHYAVAYKRFQTLARKRTGLVLDESLLVKMINGTEKQAGIAKLHQALLKYYVRHHERLLIPVTLKLAKHSLIQQQPRQTLKTLQQLDLGSLSDAQQASVHKLAARAKRAVAAGTIELKLSDDD